MAGFITIIEVVGAGIVEIDGFLDEPQSQGTGVKVKVSQCVTGDCGDVVNA
jgi:hypothetical protein